MTQRYPYGDSPEPTRLGQTILWTIVVALVVLALSRVGTEVLHWW